MKRHHWDIEKIKLAGKFFKKKDIGIEVPLFPDKKKEIFSFIKKVARFVSFVNLNELEMGDSNFNYILKKYNLNKNGYTVSNSIRAGLWIMKKGVKEKINLKIHLCTAETKNWFQYKNRLLKHSILPFGEQTKDGTVIYYFISKDKNENFEMLKKKIGKNEGYYDERKQRIILNKKHAGKYSDFIVTRAEEYPTYDGIEVEREEL